MTTSRGMALVLSGPSGAGKSTIVHLVQKHFPTIVFSVSCTTRAPRPGERDGVDYHFLTPEAFEADRLRGEFLEYACVHGNYYGTPKTPMISAIEAGRIIVLDIDVQGARQVRASLGGTELAKSVRYVFVAPPSLEELEARLRGRGTETEDAIQKRLANARGELAAADEYEYLIVNRQAESAARELEEILSAGTK